MTLKHKTFSAVRWTTVAAVFRAVLQIAQVAVLARLLAPEHYGLMAMVLVVLAFGQIFSDLGVNSAYVQRQNVTQEERSSLFWLNVAMSSGLTVMVLVFSPLIAGFFGDDRLVPLLMLAATTFVIIALGQQVRMTAEKALAFRPVVMIEIFSAVLGFVAAVSAAYAGWGVYALIVGGITVAASNMLLFWIFLSHGWRPIWRFRLVDVRSYLGFGGALVGNNIVNQINKDIDLLLGGRMLAATALGLYSLPRQVVFQVQGMINPIITRVAFPLIAQVQTDIPRVRAIYLKTLNTTAAINAPLYVGIAFFAPELVRIVFGDKWLASADLLRLLAIWGFFRSIGNPAGSFLLGMGRADLSLKWNLGLLFVVPPVLWAGSQFGVMGLAWTLLGLSFVKFIPGWFILVRPLCHARLWEYSVAALRPFLIAVTSIGPVFFVTKQINNDIIHLLLAVTISAPIYVAISYKANQEWFDSMVVLILPKRLAERLVVGEQTVKS